MHPSPMTRKRIFPFPEGLLPRMSLKAMAMATRPLRTRQGIDPEKQHNWWTENLKNIAALAIVAFCLIMIAAFAGIQFGWPGADGGDAVAKASDVFKLIATTALGFLFGRNSK